MMKTKEELLNDLKIIYEDNHLIVVEKEPNVLTQKDQTLDIDMTEIVKEYIKIKYQKKGNVYLGLVHRLDRRVGGVLVLAKTSKASKRLSDDFKNHNVDKYYLAKAKGIIKENGTINIKLKKDEKTKLAIISNDGKESILHYEIIDYDQNATFLKVKLITGRYNQIRASFNYIKHPLINDYKYDKSIIPNRDDLGLWCYEVSINHPITKQKMTFNSYPNKDIWKNLKVK